MSRTMQMLAGFVVVLAVGALAAGVPLTGAGASGGERPDCPGKITCPLTGEEVCRDACPTVDANRSDCPGRIECPITGELVCVDRCPAETSERSNPEARPTCCR